jgi:glycosyltransferase involved in cell wall biosynthesis
MTHERFPHLFNKPWDEALRIRKRKCLLSADAIICISETTATDLEHFCHVSMERIWVIPLAFSAAFHVLPDLQHTHFEPFLLYVGDRSHYKNFTRLLEAYAVWSQFKEVALVVVGRGWTQQEQLLLEKLGITQRVRLLTNVADKKLCQLYNQATAFVYPSLYEGFGIPLLEAMACGCPIVASRISSTIEVAENIPIYFDATETAELVAALKQAFIEGRDSQRTKAGLKHVQQYSWDKTANDTLGVYRSLT